MLIDEELNWKGVRVCMIVTMMKRTLSRIERSRTDGKLIWLNITGRHYSTSYKES